MNKLIFIFMCAAFLAAPLSLVASPKDAALVLSVDPGVESILAAQRAALVPKMEVPLKATVKSDATGHSQLMFPDDATITISPNSEVVLTEFVDDPEEENIVLDMAVGTMRVITGEASRRNPAAFTVNTPQATIGIRGTMVVIQVSGDMTRVYLSETSGKGVSVRNKSTGRDLEIRSPGYIITVGPRVFEERKATRQQVAQLRALLQRPAPQVAAMQSQGRQAAARRLASGRLAAPGTLPFTTSISVAQMDESNRAHEIAYVTPAGSRGSAVTPVAPVVPVTPGTPSTPDTPPVTPDTPATPGTSPGTPGTPSTPDMPAPDVPPVPSVPDIPPSTPGNTPVTPDVPVNPSTFKVTMPELAGNFAGNGNFNYYYVQDPGTAFGSARPGEVSFTVPQNYVSLDNDVYTINLTNVKVPGFQNGNYVAAPAGHDLEVRIDRQSGTLSQSPGQITTTPQEIRALMLKGNFDNNQAGSLDTVHFTAGTDASGMPLRGRNQGQINITKR